MVPGVSISLAGRLGVMEPEPFEPSLRAPLHENASAARCPLRTVSDKALTPVMRQCLTA